MTDQLDALPEITRIALDQIAAALRESGCGRSGGAIVKRELLRLTGDCNAERLRADTYTAKYEVMRELAEKAEARVQELERENGELRHNEAVALELWNAAIDRAERAEAELAAVEKRIAEAATGIAKRSLAPGCLVIEGFDDDPSDYHGERVALLPLGDEAKS